MAGKLSMLSRPRGLTDPAVRDHEERLVAVWKLVAFESGASCKDRERLQVVSGPGLFPFE